MIARLENNGGIMNCTFKLDFDVQQLYYTPRIYKQRVLFTGRLEKLTELYKERIDSGINMFELLAILSEMKLSEVNDIHPYIRDKTFPLDTYGVLVRKDNKGLYRVLIKDREWLCRKEQESKLIDSLYNCALEIVPNIDRKGLGQSILNGLFYNGWE